MEKRKELDESIAYELNVPVGNARNRLLSIREIEHAFQPVSVV